jgi:hypothetical protein
MPLAWADQPVPRLGQAEALGQITSPLLFTVFFQFLNSFFQYKFQKIV